MRDFFYQLEKSRETAKKKKRNVGVQLQLSNYKELMILEIMGAYHLARQFQNSQKK